MANDGVITRKDIIQDEALRWGEEYAKNLEIAIKANKEFVGDIKELATAYKSISNASSNSELIKAKEQERLANMQALNAVKQLEAADRALEKVKQEQLKTIQAQTIAEQKLLQEKQKTALATTKAEEAERKANESKEKATKLTIEERVQNEYNNKVLKEAAMQKLGLIGAYQKLNKERTDAKRKVMDLIASENASNAEIKKAQVEFDKLDKKVRQADKAVGDFTKNVGNYPQIGKMTGMLRDLVGAFGIGLGVTAFVAGIKEAWKTVKEFDTAITELSAVTEVPKKQLGSLKNTIIEVSKTSVNSAVDVAKLAVELSKLGASTSDIEKMIGTVDMFSVAMEASGDESAQFLLGIMNAFGESADQAEHYGNVMANAANISALGFKELQDSMKYVAPVANAANVSLERVTAMTGLLVDNNLEASQAGTALRSIMLRLAKDGLTYDEAMQKINSSSNKLATATKMFGTEASTAAIILSSNTQKLGEYEAKLLDSEGALRKLNETKMDSLENQVKALSSAWDGFILSIESGDGAISRFVKSTISGLTKVINLMSNANKSWNDLQDETYRNTYSDTTKTLMNTVASDAVIIEARKKAVNENRNYNEVLKETTEYYQSNKKALDDLIESQKKGFTQSSIYSSGIKPIQKDLDLVNSKIKEQEELVTKLTKNKNEGSVLSNAIFGRYDQLEVEEKKLQQLITSQKNYQAQLDAYNNYGIANSDPISAPVVNVEEDDKVIKAREKAREDYLKKLQKLAREEYELNIWRLNRAKELNQEIIDDENASIEDRIAAYQEVQQLEESIARETAEFKLKELSWYDDKVRDLTQSEIDTLLKGGQIKKQLSNAEILILEQLQAKRDDITQRQEKNLQKLADAEVKRVQKDIDKSLQVDENNQNIELREANNQYKVLLDSQLINEKSVEEHEQRILDIKNKYLKKGILAQMDAMQMLMDNEILSLEEREKAEAKYYELRRQYSEIDIERMQADNEKRLEAEKKYNEQMLNVSIQLKDALVDLTNVIFDARLQKIDDDIAKSEEYYSRQMELAGEDQAQKDLLEAEAEKKRQELEKKKRQEQTKQAIFNKAMKVLDIGIATALAVMNAVAQFPMTGGMPFSAMALGIGAVQTAAVLATPIPKYKSGRKDGKKEIAWLGDGGVSEVLERKKGGIEITPAYDTLYQLEQGDIVHKSVDDFFKSKLNSMNKGLLDSQSKMNNYQEMISLNFARDPELLEEMKKNTAAVKNSKPIVIQSKTIDINYELWRMNQTKWNN